MIAKEITMRVVLRLSTKGDKSQGSLFLRIIHNRKIRTITIPNCYLSPEEWDSRAQKVIYSKNNLRQRKRYLTSVANKIAKEKENVLTQIRQCGNNFNLDKFIDRYRHNRRENNSLLNYCENLAQHLEKTSHERTARAYRCTARRFINFNLGKDILLSEIDADLIKKFEIRLKKESVSYNTISFYMRNLRSVYNKAIKENLIEAQMENPFVDVPKLMQVTVKRALPASDMQRVLHFDFSLCRTARQEQRFRMAQRLFLFSFYTRGMCFIDIAYLRKQNIQHNVIRYYRQKTGRMIEVKVTAEIRNIIDSFAEETSDSPYVFPIIKTELSKKARIQYEAALRMQNSRLQQMAEIAGVQRKITMHVARHSWASIGRQNNLPLSVISECLGHSDERVTAIYLASLDKTILDDANDKVVRAVHHCEQ